MNENMLFSESLARNGFSGAAHRINNEIIQWHILKLSSTRRPCGQLTIKCAFNLLKSNENVLFAFANSAQPILIIIIRHDTSPRMAQNADKSCAFFVNKPYSYSNRMTAPLFQSQTILNDFPNAVFKRHKNTVTIHSIARPHTHNVSKPMKRKEKNFN